MKEDHSILIRQKKNIYHWEKALVDSDSMMRQCWVELLGNPQLIHSYVLLLILCICSLALPHKSGNILHESHLTLGVDQYTKHVQLP